MQNRNQQQNYLEQVNMVRQEIERSYGSVPGSTELIREDRDR